MAQTTSRNTEPFQPGSPKGLAEASSHPEKITSLTPRQQEAFDLLVSFVSTRGYPPATSELAELMGVSSPNAAAEHLKALERKGFITIARGLSRGITIVGSKEPVLAVQLLQELIDGLPGARGRAVEFLKLYGEPL